MKKIFTLCFAFLLLLGFSFGTHTNTSSQWHSPVHNQNINFQATYQNGVVSMNWNQISHTQSNWQYRKVVRSTSLQQPYYPDHGYIKAIGSEVTTSYTDTNPPVGTVYYGVCAITQNDAGRYRNCDWQSVTVDGTYVEPNSTTTTYEKPKPTVTSTNLSDALKDAVDSLVENLMDNLEDKFGDDVDSKIDLLETLVDKLGNTNVSYRVKPLINYLVAKLEDTIALLEIESLLNID